MRRSLTVFLALALLCLPPAGARAQAQVPPLQDAVVQDVSSSPLPEAERLRLEQALTGLPSGLRFKVLLVDDGGGEPWPALPNAVREAWQLPEKTILFVVGTQLNYRIRFYFYQNVNGTGVTPENTTAALSSHYFPAVREGRVVDGLIALAGELDRLAGGTGVPAPPEPAPVQPDPEPDPAPAPAPAERPAAPGIDWGDLLEKPWLPIGLGVAGIVLVIMGLLGIRSTPPSGRTRDRPSRRNGNRD